LEPDIRTLPVTAGESQITSTAATQKTATEQSETLKRANKPDNATVAS